MFRGVKYTLSIASALLFSSTFIFGQVTGGAVTGAVTDANGAIVPNVRIKLADKARGQVFTTQTTGTGSFLYPNVPVGEYTITIEQAGFETVAKDLTVSLNQTITVDTTLQIAGSKNEVNVVAGGDTLVQTDTSQVGKSFQTRGVQDLPNAGNVNALAALAPNVLPNPVGLATTTPVIGGVRPRGNTFNVDGVDNDDPGVTGPATAPIQDAVEEFTLLQNNFNAEFGAGAGGQFNTVTKSGTNHYHGSVFAYIDSQKLNGGIANDTLTGGEGNDLIIGAQGIDTEFGGAGDDTSLWNPGDANDIFEGQDGQDTLLFNGANIAEKVVVSANGPRLSFTRDIAGIVMDCDDTEKVVFTARGGADLVTVNDLSGTDVREVKVDLSAVPDVAGGDNAADTVIVKGTAGNDVITLAGSAGSVTATGLTASVTILGSEIANDVLSIDALAGDDVVQASGLGEGIIGLIVNGGDGDDNLVGSAGNDTLLGGIGDDVLIGGPGIDVIDGGPGANVIIQD